MSYMKDILNKAIEDLNWKALANDFIDSHVELYGLEETMIRLFEYGLTDIQVIALDFEIDSVSKAYEQWLERITQE